MIKAANQHVDPLWTGVYTKEQAFGVNFIFFIILIKPNIILSRRV
ncbi:hypothetical protein PBCV1_a232aR [Paramecium bursaria Chlorella virus 1]|uniref:Uncharacterized protein n=1 Tax=Paramecium bursaria Chlorella virus 1 TaxID=10506 RepID=F8TU00_PBCV1|nr:hypothetical protein PBCV1_a232aR [Paramecium bursaria Chlorella virus 1]AEI70061.1 hypothetical protein [Paramecium bursaria Chlorella virus 1]